MLISNVALILQLRGQRNLDLGQAITAIATKPLGILIVLPLSIVVASVMMQAFEFGAIRLLEGYWESFRILTRLSTLRTKHHVSRLARLKKRYYTYSRRAFNEARDTMLDHEVPRHLVDVLDKQNRDEPLDDQDLTRVIEAERLGWRSYASPELLRRMDAAERRIEEYPKPHRILPTRLGNVLRSNEEQLEQATGEKLEEYVYRRYDLITPRLMEQHQRFRSRLDIYSLLTFIFAGLAMVSPVALVRRPIDLSGGFVFAVVYVILALVSYQATISSARGYGLVLRAIDSQSRVTDQD